MEKRQSLALSVIRQKAGLTQVELALAIDTSQTVISRWEKEGDIPPAKAEALLAVIRAHSRDAVPAGFKPADLSRPWDEVLLERAAVKV